MDTNIGAKGMLYTPTKKLSAVFKVLLALALVMTMTPTTNAFAEGNTPQPQLLGLEVETSNTTQGVIEGTVFKDQNANGKLDAREVPVADCVVTYGDPTDKTSAYATTKTDAQGKFSFSGVSDGSYTVRVASQSINSETYVSTQEAKPIDPLEEEITLETPVVEQEPVIEPEPTAENEPTLEPEPTTESEAIEETEEAPEVTEPEETTNSISGIVWLDENEDGIHDNDESIISEYPVDLYQDGAVIMSTVTDTEGAYSFADLEAGNYQVGVSAQTVNDTEYLIPIKMLQAGSDNTFDANFDLDPVVSLTESILLEDDTQAADINAGMRGGQAVEPMAGGTLTVNTSSYPISITNLQNVLEVQCGFTAQQIADADTLVITGNNQGTPLTLSNSYGSSASIGYFKSTLNIQTLDLSGFTGTLGNYGFMATSLTTVVLGDAITSLPSSVFSGCSSLSALCGQSGTLTPGVFDFASTKVNDLTGEIQQFAGCAQTTVILSDAITTLPYGVFRNCANLTTLYGESGPQTPGVIDLASTKISTLSGESQFSGCPEITTVILGDAITTLPAQIFSGCSKLSSLYGQSGSQVIGVIDLASTKVDTLSGSAPFNNCPLITTVTLGDGITSLPAQVFGNCRNLSTLYGQSGSQAPGVIDLASTKVSNLESGGAQFIYCAQTTVTLGDGITSLPGYVFSQCPNFTTLYGTSGSQTPGMIDLISTKVDTLGSGGNQFYNCRQINTVTLGDGITTLPTAVFRDCRNLTTLYGTSGSQTPGMIDLMSTKVDTLESEGLQFMDCLLPTTVTLGDGITSLPPRVFMGCTNLSTLYGQTSAQTPGVIDLASTKVDTLEVGTSNPGGQFLNFSATTVVLGDAITFLPMRAFNGPNFITLSDSLANAQGDSEGFIDFGKFSSMTLQSNTDHFVYTGDTIGYIGLNAMTLPAQSFAACPVFVPETISDVTVTGSVNNYQGFYVRAPESSSPTTVTGASYLSRIDYYLDVTASTDGKGTITPKTGNPGENGFLGTKIDAKERRAGNLAADHNYAIATSSYTPSSDLTYTITPNTNYVVDKITATVGGVTTDITSSCSGSPQGGDWIIPAFSDDTEYYVTFELPFVVYDDVNSTGNTYIDPATYAIGDTVTVLGYDAVEIQTSGFSKPARGVFVHWNTEADDSGTSYNLGSTFSYSEGITLYAIYGLYRVDGASSGYLGVYDTLQDAVDACQTHGTGEAYTISALDNDPDMGTSAVTIPAGHDITLTSWGSHVWTITQQANDRHFNSGDLLTLKDITLAGKGLSSGSDNNGGISVEGTLNIESGTTIRNCYGASFGGAVQDSGTGTITMNGAEISGNKAEFGGGVALTSTGSFDMAGGKIIGNTATKEGGGIYTADYSYKDPSITTKYANITIASGAIVSGNTSGRTANAPTNANDFTTRGTNPFNGALLTNDQINFRSLVGVTYDANNSTSGTFIDPVTYDAGDTVTVKPLSGTTLSADTGYVIDYWCTEAGGKDVPGATSYAADGTATFTIAEDTTLYAIWKLAEYDLVVNYVDEAGTSIATQETITDALTYNTAYSITAKSITDYAVKGWYLGDPSIISSATLSPMATAIAAASVTGSLEITIVYEETYSVIYNDNGGQGDGPAADTGILDGATHTLNTSGPTHAQVGGVDVLFVGWSETQTSGVYEKDQTISPAAVTSVTIASADKTVYAIWGYDRDNSGVPDVLEDWYDLIYDENTGNNDGPATARVRDTTSPTLSATGPTHNPVGGVDVLFVGWSETATSGIYEKDQTISPVAVTSVTIAGADKTVYAIWGYDRDNSGVPDVLEEWYDLIYDENGGNNDGPATTRVRDTTSPTLSTTGPTHNPVGGVNVLFVGWSETATSGIYEKDQTISPAAVTSVTIAGADKTVYAIWGYDRDNSGVPDVLEDWYDLIYDRNNGNNDGPATERVRDTTSPTLSTTGPTHLPVGGVDVLFVGWSASPDPVIYEKDATITPTPLTSVTIAGSDKTVYAIWGYDRDNSGVPDVLEDWYDLIYDENGGNNDGPATERVRDLTSPTLSTTGPTHNPVGGVDVLFIGWSETPTSSIYEKDQTISPAAVTTVTIAGTDKTVYAIWGYDRDNSGVPDVLEDWYDLIYDVNAGNNDGPSTERVRDTTSPTLSSTGPTHNQVGGIDVLFVGWSADPDSTIYEKDATITPAPLTSVTIAGADKTVYALWGYDRDNSGVPDVLEDWYDLIYDENGGNNDGPATERVRDTTSPTLSTTGPTHNPVGGVNVLFVGWSETPTSGIYEKDQTISPAAVTTVTIAGADKTVYAIWGYDRDNSGVPDVLEDWYDLIYDKNNGNNDGPATIRVRDLTSPTLSSTGPTHLPIGGVNVLFVGWSASPDATIYEKDATITPAPLTSVTIVGSDKTVYALWGYDRDNSGVPDVLEDWYDLIYDVNTGNNDGPATARVRDTTSPTLSATGPTHNPVGGVNVLFVGWSETPTSSIYEKDQTISPAAVTSVTIAGTDKTVYAIWGYDRDNSGVPDVLEDWYDLIYDVNTGNNDGPATERVRDTTSPTLSATGPTHNQVGGIDVLFVGWSANPDSTIYEKDATITPAPLTSVTIAGADKTVYALWEYDRDNSGVPDVLEDWHDLIYDVNGGNNDGPATTRVRDLTTPTLSVTGPTHNQVSGIDVLFVGWSASPDPTIYEKDDVITPGLITSVAINGSDKTVYAVWGYDRDSSGKPDVLENYYDLIYDVNTGNNDGPATERILDTTSATLATTGPTHTQVGGVDVLFVGWSATPDSTIYEKDATISPAPLTSVTISGTDVTVYAIWGYDRDNSGVPDVLEDWYDLIYDVNTGNNDGPATTRVRDTSTPTLSATGPTHNPVGGIDVLFVGWSETPTSAIYEKDQTISPAAVTTVTIAGANKTVYAIWGYDRDNSGVPDVLETYYDLIYNVNGGNNDGPATERVLDTTSPTLSATGPTHTQVGGVDVLFVGWSETPTSGIYEKDQTISPAAVTTVTIAGADKTVYAIWGYDRDSSGVPDVLETYYDLIYNVNGGNNDGPATARVLDTTSATLSATGPTHSQIAGVDVLFVGWSETPTSTIYEKDQTISPAAVTTVTVNGADKTVYAIWGYDRDNSGVPDVLETYYDLIYDVNGGNNDGPATERVLDTTSPTLSTTGPTHNPVGGVDVLFVGWSETATLGIYEKDQTISPAAVTTVTISGADKTVYAIWGYDRDNSGVPDVLETYYDLIYNVNGGNNDGPATARVLDTTSATLSATGPTHNPVGGIDVLFVGWSETATSGIYEKDQTISPAAVTTVTINGANKTVYAIWGYDRDNSGVPDVLETYYDLIYNPNGGNNDGPATARVLDTTSPTLSTTGPTHNPVGGVDVAFIGWSAIPDTRIYAKTDTVPTPITSVTINGGDKTVYAIWGYDTNSNNVPDVNEIWYTITENFVDRTGNVVDTQNTLSFASTDNYVVTSAPAIYEYVYVGYQSTAPTSGTPSTVNTPSVFPGATPVTSDMDVYYIYGQDKGGSPTPGPDGTEDITITRHWSFISGGAYVAVGSSTPEIEYVNIGDTFTKNESATPAPTIPAGYTYSGYLTDADALTTTPYAGSPAITATLGQDRSVHYVYAANPYWVAFHVVDTTDTAITTITAPVAYTGLITGSTWGPVTAPAGGVYYNYVGWKEGLLGSVNTTPIQGTIAASNLDIYLIYSAITYSVTYDVNGGRVSSAPAPDTSIMPNTTHSLTATVPTHVNSGTTPVTFIGWSTTKDTHIYTKEDSAPTTITSIYVNNNKRVYALWGLDTNNNGVPDVNEIWYKVRENYVDRTGKVLRAAKTTLYASTDNFTPTSAPAITERVYVGWQASKPSAGTPSVVNAPASFPSATPVAGNMSVFYIYGQDKGGSPTPGPDGYEDVTITESVYCIDNVLLDGPYKVYVNIGDVYAGTTKSYAGHTYAGYRINGGALQTMALVTPLAIGTPNFIASVDTSVSFVHAHNSYAIKTVHVDESGKTIESDSTTSIRYNESYSASPKSISGYTYKGWKLNGGTLQSGDPSIAKVKGAETITLVYAAASNPGPNPNPNPPGPNPTPPDHGNYNFVKTPNVKNVAAGETVVYTFAEFGNNWGIELDQYQISDKPDMGLDFVNAYLPAFTNGAGVTYDVSYYTNLNGDRKLHTGISAASPFYFEAPALEAGEYIKSITIEFGTVPAGFAVGDTMQMTFRVWDNPPAQTLTNVGILGYKVNGEYKEFVTGTGSVTIGGWFSGLAKMGDTNTIVWLAMLAGVSALTLILMRKRRRKQQQR